MEKQKSRLLSLLTENLQSKSAEGLENFQRQIEKEIIKHDITYGEYRKDREKHRLQALKEIEEIRLKRIRILKNKLKEVESKIELIKEDKHRKQKMLEGDEAEKYKQLEDDEYKLQIRLETYLAEDWSNYGVENLLSEPDSDGVENSQAKDPESRSVQEIVTQHLAMKDFPTAFQPSEHPYTPVYNSAGELDPWDQPWFANTFPQTLRRAFEETKREVLKKITREGLEEEGQKSSSSSSTG